MSQTKAQLIANISGGVGNGTAAAPALTGDDTDTGISFGTNEVLISTNGAEKAKLDTTGYLRLASGGIQFNGDTAAANALDDYEEGTWTPVLKDNSGNEATMTVQEGFYTKTGNIVNAWFQVAWSNKGSMTGNVRIEGWPVSSKANSSNYYYIGATISNQTTVGCIAMAGNGTVANMQPLTGPTSNQTASNLDSSGRMMCSLTYIT